MIEINNLTNSRVDKNFLKRVAKKVLKEENRERAELSIALIGPAKIRELNKKYRKKNKITDVLAFPDSEMGFGEIIICPEQVKKNAKRFGENFEKELARVLVHGILHLLGYDHEKDERGARIMKVKEEFYLSKIKFN